MVHAIPRTPYVKSAEPDSIFTPARAEQRDEPEAPVPIEKIRATFELPVELVEEMRDAVADLQGFTMSGCAEEALRVYLAYLRRKCNRGERFPSRSQPLKRGRPRRRG
jgi:hypothetical protein